MTSLRERLNSGERLIGTFCGIPEATAIEIAGRAGFDFLIFDGEHALVGRNEIESLVRAAEIVPTPFIFRVPAMGGEWIASALDAGAVGVVVPRVETAVQARSIVAEARYPPIGKRGVGWSRACSHGTNFSNYFAAANATLLLVIMLETAEGLANIQEIAAVEGIDGILIGPGDLSASLGLLGVDGQPRLEQAVSTIITACQRSKRIVGTVHYDASTISRDIDRGVGFCLIGSDVLFLKEGAARSAQAAQKIKRERHKL